MKTSKGNVVSFAIHEGLHIEENPNIESVLHIIDKLNRDSVAKYRYMGQSYIHWQTNITLNDLIKQNIVSYCSPQVYNILKR